MPFIEDDHVVETFPPDAPNEPFPIGILPRRSRRAWRCWGLGRVRHLFDLHIWVPSLEY